MAKKRAAHVCDDCGREWGDEEVSRRWPDVPDWRERVEPGGVVPSAECPVCGALCYPAEAA